MKVGTDGVLLGAWCPVEGASRVLDVGTGCGVIALMIAQRNVEAIIEGIDIDEAAIDEAIFNFEQSPWSNRLTARLQDFNGMGGEKRYDLIVSNPPYFTHGVLPTGDARVQARHTRSLTYGGLIDGASRLLTATGSLSLITGESLGQVASQTQESLSATGSVVDMEVLRPLIGMDKQEIVEIAQDIGTFETSILPYEDCCTIFVPKHPETHPNLKKIAAGETGMMDDAERMIQEAVDQAEKIRL